MRVRLLGMIGLWLATLAIGWSAGTTPATKNDAPAVSPTPPFTLAYDMPMDGFIAINVLDKKTGTILRRVVAEVSRKQGKVLEGWDLKTEDGGYVAPGEYTWTAVARPPLKLTYEYTVNNAGQPAWWAPAPAKGGGGWMADHSVPHEACAVGDVIFLGAGGAENGNALIAVDRAGNKLWGVGNPFGPFSGVSRMASDGRYCYVMQGTDVVRIDPQNNFVRQPIKIDYGFTRELPPPIPGGGAFYDGGLAARNGKLYMTITGKRRPWVKSSFTAGEVDSRNCVPPVVLKSRPETYGEDYTEVEKFHAAFSDGGAANSINALFGDPAKSGGGKGPLTICFTKPVALGTVLVPDMSIQVYALKAGITPPKFGGVPDDPDEVAGDTESTDPDLWEPLETFGQGGRAGLAVPKHGFATRALRFIAPRLPYALVMERRFEDVAPQAERVCTDGTLTPTGWSVERDTKVRTISKDDPAAVALVWKQPVKVRGLSLLYPSEAFMKVDVWTGPDDADPQAAIADTANWKEVGSVEPSVHGFRAQTPMTHHVDFGETYATRAVRVRAVMPDGTRGYMGSMNPVPGAHRAAFRAILVYRPLGNDVSFEQEMPQRIAEIQLPDDPRNETARVVRNIPLTRPDYLTFSPDGTLYGVSDSRVVSIPLAGGEPKPVIDRGLIGRPRGLAFDADGLLYVADQTPKVVKVFDVKTGKLVRTIGTPGGAKLGPWDASRLMLPYGLAVDSAGKLWVADCDIQPKRVVRFSRDGKVEAEYLGPAFYGGGGHIDPGDPSILNYFGMKFIADRAASTWKLDSIIHNIWMTDSVHGNSPDRAFYFRGRRYLLADPGGIGFWGGGALICIEEHGIGKALVAAGNLGDWEDVGRRPDLKAKFGKLNRTNYGFLWIDQNGDHQPQADEVQITTANALKRGGKIGEDFSLNFAGARLRMTGMREDGTPLYDLAKLEVLPKLGTDRWTTADGTSFTLQGDGDHMIAPDGKTELWFYPDRYHGVHGSHNIGHERPPGTLVGEWQTVGHFSIGGEELFVTNGNHGDWFAFTRDGLLAAAIFGGPVGYGKRQWTMPEWQWGKTDLSDLTLGDEHFGGSITKAVDGHVYAVAGHNHNSVVRVDGLESMRRLQGTITVTKADIEATRAWDVQRAASEQLKKGPCKGEMPFTEHAPAIDGIADEWQSKLFLPFHGHFDNEKQKMVTDGEAALAFDNDNLYVCARVTVNSNLPRNSGEEMRNLFKFGDAIDVMLGMDPDANPRRTSPAVGDIRVLITRVKGKPVAELYSYRVPGTPEGKKFSFKSPITETIIDLVAQAKEAVIATGLLKDGGWVLEAAIPWKELGVEAPPVGAVLKGDVGMLVGDEHGLRTVSRWYWSGKSQTIVSDLAFEAQAVPLLWGELTTSGDSETMPSMPD